MKKNLSVMIKPASAYCNLKCEYCFYSDVASEREIEKYPFMSLDTAKNIVKKALAFANGGSIYFAFQGGEPLLVGLKFYKTFVEYVNSYNSLNSEIYYNLQTNGLLINDEFAKFFYKHDFLLGVSLDGDRENNLYRLDLNKNETFKKVLENIDTLQYHRAKYNILIVATKNFSKNVERILGFFHSRHMRYLQIIPCLRPFNKDYDKNLYMDENDYANYLIKSFLLYIDYYLKGEYLSIRYFDNLVRKFYGEKTEQCGLSGHCTFQYIFEANGNAYPCDFYCLDKYLLGNINTNSFSDFENSKVARDFINQSFLINDKCTNCEYEFLCKGGGCKRNREDYDYCSAYKIFFKLFINNMKYFKHEFAR